MISTVLDGRFRVEDVIAKGVSGGVYRGIDLQTKQRVALKLLFMPPNAGANFGVRFRQEFEVMRKLRHPNIVKVIHAGLTTNDIMYFAMELLTGRTLKQMVQTHGPLPPAKVADYLDSIASALEVAHSMDIIHRDINPSNILIHGEGTANEVPKLLDFGLAKVLTPDPDDPNPATGRLRMGTAAFMCPEQVDGKPPNRLWDVYALGVTLYMVLTGKLPFDKGGELQTLTAVMSEPPPPFEVSNPNNEVPAGVEEVVKKALSKKPSHRPQSAAELATMFRLAVENPNQSITRSAVQKRVLAKAGAAGGGAKSGIRQKQTSEIPIHRPKPQLATPKTAASKTNEKLVILVIVLVLCALFSFFGYMMLT